VQIYKLGDRKVRRPACNFSELSVNLMRCTPTAISRNAIADIMAIAIPRGRVNPLQRVSGVGENDCFQKQHDICCMFLTKRMRFDGPGYRPVI